MAVSFVQETWPFHGGLNPVETPARPSSHDLGLCGISLTIAHKKYDVQANRPSPLTAAPFRSVVL